MRKLKLTATTGLMAGLLLTSLNVNAAPNQSLSTLNFAATAKKLEVVAPDISPHVLTVALKAYDKARKQGYDAKQIFSVIDFSIPTYKKTLWIFNLASDKVLYHTYVAHGKGSGLITAKYFSNKPGSLTSSLGMYVTGKTFYGNDGYSLRLRGLSGQFNDNAYARDIVMHGAWYVSQSFVNEYDRVGRSWGCTAVSKKLVKPIINTVKNGTLLFAYANDKYWQEHGPYMT